jgi:GAF domain-containing protein
LEANGRLIRLLDAGQVERHVHQDTCLLGFASQAAIAITNAQLYSRAVSWTG